MSSTIDQPILAPDASLANRVLLVGWDAADWSLLRPLLASGLMPNLAALMQRGCSGTLEARPPLLPATLWTTLGTGIRATEHKVFVAEEISADGSHLQPVGRSACHAVPFWSIAAAAGLRSHVINFPATHPAEDGGGIRISDHFVSDPDSLQSVAPGAMESTFQNLRLRPQQIDAASILSFVPNAAQLDRRDPRLLAVARFLADTATIHAAATRAMEDGPWQLIAVRYHALAELARDFMPFHAPAAPGVSDADVENFGAVITAACRFFDMMLGRLVALAGDSATILLVSPYGFRATSAQDGNDVALAAHRPRGIFVAAGPHVPAGKPIAATLLHVAPTILALLGIEASPPLAAESLMGRYPLRSVAIPPLPGAAPATLANDPSVESLRASGYSEQADPHRAAAERRLTEQRDFHTALALLDEGRTEWALPIVEQLVRDRPAVNPYQIALGHAYARLRRTEQWRQVAARLARRFPDAPQTHISTAWLAITDRKSDAAVAHLRAADAANRRRSPAISMEIGSAYLRMRRYADARAAFEQALAVTEEDADVHAGLASALLGLDDVAGAVTAARRAVQLAPFQPMHLYRLGTALAASKQWFAARESLEAAVKLDPSDPILLRKLSSLCQRCGDADAAREFDRRAHLAAFNRRAEVDPQVSAADTTR